MGKRDSTKTRVEPVFNALLDKPDWIERLLSLTQFGNQFETTLSTKLEGKPYFSPTEKKLAPPLSLLKWLIKNWRGDYERGHLAKSTKDRRARLASGDCEIVATALSELSKKITPPEKGWFILEGPTYPDVYVSTEDCVIVIEGKRTERGPTTSTTYMAVRHQILRHIDCAYELELCGRKRPVFGFFIVEADKNSNNVPAHWVSACKDTLSEEVVRQSLPHRTDTQKSAISEGFLGATTWQTVCKEFDLPVASILVDRA